MQLFARKDEKTRENIDDGLLEKADMQRKIRKLEMRIINLNKKVDRFEERLDKIDEDVDMLFDGDPENDPDQPDPGGDE